jgi:hypothetical protein
MQIRDVVNGLVLLGPDGHTHSGSDSAGDFRLRSPLPGLRSQARCAHLYFLWGGASGGGGGDGEREREREGEERVGREGRGTGRRGEEREGERAAESF